MTNTDHLHRRHILVHRQWIERAKTDPEYGGPTFAQNLDIAKAAVDRFGGHSLRRALEETGMGSHPEIIRAFWNVGRAMNRTPPQAPARPAKTFAQQLYSKSNLNP